MAKAIMEIKKAAHMGGKEAKIVLERKVVKFTVNCPLFSFSKEKMEIEFVKQENGWFPLPCNGCDMLNGDPLCEKCCAALTLMFYDDPDTDVSRPIAPPIWKYVDSRLSREK